MSTPIEKAAEKVAFYFVELPKPRDIDEVVAIVRQELRKHSNSDVIDDITEGKCTCPVGSYTACPVHK